VNDPSQGEGLMDLTRRLGILALGAAMVGVVGSVRPAVAQTREARGQVISVSDSALTVQAGERRLTFVMDGATHVEASGAGKRTRQARSAGVSSGIRVTDYVKAGGAVAVSYREIDGKNRALTVRPIASAGSGGGLTSNESPKLAHGKVKSITGGLLTLEQDGRDMTFTVDRDTDVLARGAGKATRMAGGGVPFTDLVHNGDIVTVLYRDVNGSLKVSEIQIRGRNTIAAR
jgi:hypothetical protein